jgi:hypothetical protein
VLKYCCSQLMFSFEAFSMDVLGMQYCLLVWFTLSFDIGICPVRTFFRSILHILVVVNDDGTTGYNLLAGRRSASSLYCTINARMMMCRFVWSRLTNHRSYYSKRKLVA